MSFDRLAPHYRWTEWLLAGRKLQRCRTAFLRSIPMPRHALLLGEGNGRFLIEFLRAWPGVRVTCVEGSRRMIDCARSRVRKSSLSDGDVEFVHADILDWSAPSQKFDLIVSHFFLDCFRPEQLEDIVHQVAATAAPGGRWLLADFREPPTGLARWRARLILWAMYLFFQRAVGLPATKLTAPDDLLIRHGFVLHERRLSDWGLLHTDLWVDADILRANSGPARRNLHKPTQD